MFRLKINYEVADAPEMEQETGTEKETEKASETTAAEGAGEVEAAFWQSEITDDIFARIRGKSYRDDCTVPREELRYLHALHKNLEGEILDLNTASEADLTRLPGIGEKRAADIAAWREENGGFAAEEELMEVSGIGEGTYERVAPYITVGEEEEGGAHGADTGS